MGCQSFTLLSRDVDNSRKVGKIPGCQHDFPGLKKSDDLWKAMALAQQTRLLSLHFHLWQILATSLVEIYYFHSALQVIGHLCLGDPGNHSSTINLPVNIILFTWVETRDYESKQSVLPKEQGMSHGQLGLKPGLITFIYYINPKHEAIMPLGVVLNWIQLFALCLWLSVPCNSRFVEIMFPPHWGIIQTWKTEIIR